MEVLSAPGWAEVYSARRFPEEVASAHISLEAAIQVDFGKSSIMSGYSKDF